MTVQILLDETPFGVRGAVLEGEVPVKILHAMKGDKAPRTGQLFWAKVGRRDARMGSVICDLGDHQEGILLVKDRTYSEGQTIAVAIRREGMGSKRPLLTDRPSLRLPAATLSLAEGAKPQPGPLGSLNIPTELLPPKAPPTSGRGRIDQVSPIARLLTGLAVASVQEVIASNGSLLASVNNLIPDSLARSVSDQVPDILNAMEDDAMARIVGLDGGGALIIDETEALTAVDVDLGASAGQSKKGADSALLRRALQSLGPALSLRGIGGQVVVDLPRGAVRAPQMIRDQLTAVLKPFGLMSVPAVTKSGLVCLIFGQDRAPVREHLTEEVEGAFVVPPRRYRAPVVAQRAYASLNQMLQTNPSGRFNVDLRADVLSLWEASGASAGLKKAHTDRFRLQSTDASDFAIAWMS
ncbi:MAG: ribonuclease E/G [Pseudomonadota bacterium]